MLNAKNFINNFCKNVEIILLKDIRSSNKNIFNYGLCLHDFKTP